jgi:KRAB domain-containing zinc finger protein
MERNLKRALFGSDEEPWDPSWERFFPNTPRPKPKPYQPQRSREKSRNRQMSKKPEEQTCDICKKTFSSEFKLHRHRTRHFPPSKPAICEVQFNRISHYFFCLRLKNSELNWEHVCLMWQVCGRVCMDKGSLRQHRFTHMPRQFECDFCKRRFVMKGAVREHVRTHLEVRSFVCGECNASFKVERTLRGHILNVHHKINNDPQTCTLCGLVLNNKRCLERHLRTHSGERPYACDLCEARYGHSNRLVSHKMSVHKIMPHNCKVCLLGFRVRRELITHSLDAHNLHL